MRPERRPSPSGPHPSALESEAYGAFAYAYDKALGERFFAAARGMLDGALDRFPTTKRTHLDVACGTGLAGNYFRGRGWKSIGVDASLPMLSVANRRSKVSAGFLAGDLRALPFRTRFARITCLYDSLNHLIDRNDLVAAFRAVSGVMDRDSLFLFDMNHPEIYPAVWGIADPFVAEGRDFHLEIATTFRKRESLGRAMVTGWADIDGSRVIIREQHRQRAYSEREIVQSLADAGLQPVDVIEFDPYNDGSGLNTPTVKLFFICAPAGTENDPKRFEI